MPRKTTDEKAIDKGEDGTAQMSLSSEIASTPDDIQQVEPQGAASTSSLPKAEMLPSCTSNVSQARDQIAKKAQQLIEEINAKRQRDTQLLENFRKELDEHVQKTCASLEEAMFDLYQKQSELMQEKLQVLFAVLDRISQTENEIAKFKEGLNVLYHDMSK